MKQSYQRAAITIASALGALVLAFPGQSFADYHDWHRHHVYHHRQELRHDRQELGHDRAELHQDWYSSTRKRWRR
jgi:hypothetical protein